MSDRCEVVNTYQVLEHVMGIHGLHPHRLDTVRHMRDRLVRHVNGRPALDQGVVLDIGCGSGAGTRELAEMFGDNRRVVGIDINKEAIDKAAQLHGDMPNLSFYHGNLQKFSAANPEIGIAGAISVSVSMFILDVADFYRHLHACLLDGGMFVDAPFMFRNMRGAVPEAFCAQTYSVCGCSMKMFQLDQLLSLLRQAGFSSVDCAEHDFDLMKLPVLFHDYPASYLVGNFLRNVMSPPACIGNVSSRYLLSRTMKIFIFFLRNRAHYASGEFVAVKRSM